MKMSIFFFLVRGVSVNDEEKILKLHISTDTTMDSNLSAEPEPELQTILNSPIINRNYIPPNLSEKEILELLRDISAYICARDLNPQVRSWVSAQRSLISKDRLVNIAYNLMTLHAVYSSILPGIDSQIHSSKDDQE
jgi:hypothetical protein